MKEILPQVLLVEDSTTIGRLAKKRIEEEFDASVFWARSYSEAENILASAEARFSMALLDYNLPDAPEGEIIDRVVSEGISAFVFTSDLTEEVRKQVWAKKVADYILKENPNSLEYVIRAMRELEDNQETPVLVVDESGDFRNMVSELLYIRRFRVLTAQDGESALQILGQYPDIKLVFIDYHLQGMDGCTLCQKIREKVRQEDLAIIGFPPQNERSLGAKFIKNGASDFVVKRDFLVEEFYIRVSRCLESVNLVREIKEKASGDSLTGHLNRSYFFEKGNGLLEECLNKQNKISCIMLGIDYFKEINDSYGHDVGDALIHQLGDFLALMVEEGEIAARFGGAEFCLLSPGRSAGDLHERLDKFRRHVEKNMAVEAVDGPLAVTVSIGCTDKKERELELMVKNAGVSFASAKGEGGNCIKA